MALPILERIPRTPTNGNPPILILLHGRAAEAKTIFSMEGLIDGRFHVIAINAGFQSPEGGFEWFEGGEGKRSEEVDNSERFDASETALTAQIQEVLASKQMDTQNLYLLGFSQGAAMSFILGLRGILKPKGVVAMSGFLPTPIRTWSSLFTKSRYLITHGTSDEVLSPSFSQSAKAFLDYKGITAEYYEYRGRHRMTLECVQHVDQWLKRQLDESR